MTNDEKRISAGDRARLKQLLLAYGADRSNWPLAERSRFDETALSGDEIAQLAARAGEIDAVLSAASGHLPEGAARERVAAKVMAQAALEADETVVAFDAMRRLSRRRRPNTAVWPAAALIAASLVIGIALGQSEFLTGVSFSADSEPVSVVDELGNAVFGLQFGADVILEETS